MTGDESVSENAISKEVDDRVHAIMHNLDPSLARDLRVNNSRKTTFEKFCDVCEKLMDSMTVVDDWCNASGDSVGDAVVNMAISAKDLYNKWKELKEEEIPSLSLFKFQFWPKDEHTHDT